MSATKPALGTTLVKYSNRISRFYRDISEVEYVGCNFYFLKSPQMPNKFGYVLKEATA